MKHTRKETLQGAYEYGEKKRSWHFQNIEMHAEMSFLLSCHLNAKLNTLKKKQTSPEILTSYGYVHFFSIMIFDVYLKMINQKLRS